MLLPCQVLLQKLGSNFSFENKAFQQAAVQKKLVYVTGFDREKEYYSQIDSLSQLASSVLSKKQKAAARAADGSVAAVVQGYAVEPSSPRKKEKKRKHLPPLSSSSSSCGDHEQEEEEEEEEDLLGAVQKLNGDCGGADENSEYSDLGRQDLIKKLNGYKKLCRRKDKELEQAESELKEQEVYAYMMFCSAPPTK